MKTSRRMFIRGAAGVALALPALEGLMPRSALGREPLTEPFAIFFRQANGVARGWGNSPSGMPEPERFWPRERGPLTPENVEGRALDELVGFTDRLLVVGNVKQADFSYTCGHTRGTLQGLTGRGPSEEGAGFVAEAAGESLDHRIGRELNPDGRDSLFLYAGRNSGHLGGACISHRGFEDRRAPLHNPVNAYLAIMGIDEDRFATLIARQQSINDLVHEEMKALLRRPQLSASDRQRLELHQQSIRDLETTLECNLSEDEAAALEGEPGGYESTDGDQVLATARAHMDIAALAVACGYTRSVAIQVGSGGNDATTRYRNLDTGALMENYHYVSHRRLSHGGPGEVIQGADVMHHQIDRQFGRTFRHLLERLDAYETPGGQPLLDAGMAIWYNELGSGFAHLPYHLPWIIAGSAGGQLRQGEYVDAEGDINHARLLNTIGGAAGLRNAQGEYIDDFGDPSLPRQVLTGLLA